MRKAERSVILFSRLAAVWVLVLAVVAIAASSTWFVVSVRAGGDPMAGNWMGSCQDGKPFVLLNLAPAAGGYGGTISPGNVKVTSEQAVAKASGLVKDPASAKHAMKITRAVVTEKLLTFNSEHGQEYEMRMTGELHGGAVVRGNDSR